MARVPISFYLNILAGIIVVFNHYVTSETGDLALNKVTGAAGRFYALFQETAYTFLELEHEYTSHLGTAVCGRVIDRILPHDAVAYLRVHYCPPMQDSEIVRETSNDRVAYGGYGGSDFAFAHFQTPMQPLVPRTSIENPTRPSFSLNWFNQHPLSEAVWSQSGAAMAVIGTLLLRSGASWWWFKVPLKMSGFLLGIYSALLALSYLVGESMVMQCVSQVYMVAVGDFLRCIKWEAQRQALDVAVSTMERGYDFVTLACRRA